jgi:hypothetical protein
MKSEDKDILINPSTVISLSRKILFTDKEAVKKVNKSYKRFIYNNDTLLLELCSEELKNDKDLVLQLLKVNGNNLKLATDEFKDDKKLVLAAIKSKKESFQYASSRLRDNTSLVNYILKFSPRQIKHAGSRFKEDKALVSKLLKDSPVIMNYIHEDLKNDLDILIQLWTDIKKEVDDTRNDTFKYKVIFFLDDMGDKVKPFFDAVETDAENAVITKQMDSCFNHLVLEKELNQSLNSSPKKIKL